VTSVSLSIPVSNSLTKTSSLSSITIEMTKPDKEEILSNKANFSFRNESPRRSIREIHEKIAKSSQNNINEKIDVVNHKKETETINNNIELINDEIIHYNKKMTSDAESNEDKIITNLFYPILSSLDANSENKIDKQEEELNKTTLSASTESIISITCNNKINNHSMNPDGSIQRTHSSLIIYQNENNNLDFTDNDAASNIEDYHVVEVKNEENNGIYENNNNNNNFYENEIIYENIQQEKNSFVRKKSESNKSERKNSILLDKILLNDIQVFRGNGSKKDKYYVPR
jgi:hypothetical protein